MKIEVGTMVIAGETPEEIESGRVIEMTQDGESALVLWNQGTKTWAAVEDLETI